MEYIPSDILKPYIRCFAVYTTQEAGMYKILPGTNAVMGFQFKGKLKYVEQGSDISLSTSGISGLTDSYRIFKNETNTGSVLVYFKETGASVFFKEPIHEIFRESISLDNFMLRSELLLLKKN